VLISFSVRLTASSVIFIALAIITIVNTLGTSVKSTFTSINDGINTAK